MCSFLLPKLTREKNETKNREKLKHLKKKSKYNNIFFSFLGFLFTIRSHRYYWCTMKNLDTLTLKLSDLYKSNEKVSILYQRLQPLTHNFMRN